LLSKIKANSTNDGDFFFFNSIISVAGRPLWLLAPGARNVSSATTYGYSKCKQISNDCL